MTQPTKEELIKFMRTHGAENVDSITDTESAVTHFRSQAQVYKGERDEYKKQRDELIEDMAEVKRKAQAFDEIAVTVLSEDNDVIKNMNNIVTKIVINNLEREE